jgi:hypothetical protein
VQGVAARACRDLAPLAADRAGRQHVDVCRPCRCGALCTTLLSNVWRAPRVAGKLLILEAERLCSPALLTHRGRTE